MQDFVKQTQAHRALRRFNLFNRDPVSLFLRMDEDDEDDGGTSLSCSSFISRDGGETLEAPSLSTLYFRYLNSMNKFVKKG